MSTGLFEHTEASYGEPHRHGYYYMRDTFDYCLESIRNYLELKK